MWKPLLILISLTGGLAVLPDTPAPSAAGGPRADTLLLNPETGLVENEVHYLVKAQCATVCHSSQLILNNRFTRDGWKQKIRWMQATQNLWDLGETEDPILDYLEKYYAPTTRVSRRKPVGPIEWYRLP